MKKLSFKFIGSDNDKLKFVDPMPKTDQIYNEDENFKMLEKNLPIDVAVHFEQIETEIEEPVKNPHDYLTPEDRREILKLSLEFNLDLNRLEKYVAFGHKMTNQQ